MKIRFYLSLIIAKLLYVFLKITKLSSGTAIIGLISLKICPDFLIYANKHIELLKINITGTNGKTTTSGLLSHLLLKDGKKILTNSSGANMLNGIVNSMALQLNCFQKKEYSVIETDEAFLEKVYSKFDGDYLLVTNLFEDQTDRFASPLYTKSLIQKAIDMKPDLQLVLNSDEPISSTLISKNKEPIFFGVETVLDEEGNLIKGTDADCFCPICQKKLIYEKNYYSQLGFYKCGCGYSRPCPKYSANVTLYKNCSKIELNGEVYDIPLTGLYNAYNALGAIVLAKELGIENINEKMKSFKVAFGRNEMRSLRGHDTIIQLIKNPAGTNEILKIVDTNSKILIAINNNEADGKDISWISQVNFEKLATVNDEIITTGLCASEMALRLSDAGVKKVKVIPEINKAVNYVGKTAKSNITVLTTYTALLKIDKIKEMKKCF